MERVETAQHPIPRDWLRSVRAETERSCGLGEAGQLGCGPSPPRLALGARTLQRSSLAPVQYIQQLVLQQLPASSWLIPACIPGVVSFLVATENAEKNRAFGPTELVLGSLPPSSSSPTRFALAQTEASVFSKFGAQHHI